MARHDIMIVRAIWKYKFVKIFMAFMVRFSGRKNIFLPIQFAIADIVCGVAIFPMIPPIPAGVGKLCPMLKNCVIAVMASDIIMIVGMSVMVLFLGFLNVLCFRYMAP